MHRVKLALGSCPKLSMIPSTASSALIHALCFSPPPTAVLFRLSRVGANFWSVAILLLLLFVVSGSTGRDPTTRRFLWGDDPPAEGEALERAGRGTSRVRVISLRVQGVSFATALAAELVGLSLARWRRFAEVPEVS